MFRGRTKLHSMCCEEGYKLLKKLKRRPCGWVFGKTCQKYGVQMLGCAIPHMINKHVNYCLLVCDKCHTYACFCYNCKVKYACGIWHKQRRQDKNCRR